jgi:hypothetical protein
MNRRHHRDDPARPHGVRTAGGSFLLGDGIGEAVAELVVGERNGTVPVGRVPRKGKAAFSEDSGSGSTPQNGAASIATVAAD